tara:strand:+ start:1545 stop:1799 length:255 start_codon:yes stop_codon:yes gene_type:complete
MIKILLATLLATGLAAPNYGKRPRMSQYQVKRQASQITNYLKKTDPRVLREVLRQMKWQPKPKRSHKNTFDEWYIDLMRDFGGL